MVIDTPSEAELQLLTNAKSCNQMRRAVEVGNHNYPWFQKDKNYDKLRGDPEYQRIMEEVRRHWEEYKQAFGVE